MQITAIAYRIRRKAGLTIARHNRPRCVVSRCLRTPIIVTISAGRHLQPGVWSRIIMCTHNDNIIMVFYIIIIIIIYDGHGKMQFLREGKIRTNRPRTYTVPVGPRPHVIRRVFGTVPGTSVVEYILSAKFRMEKIKKNVERGTKKSNCDNRVATVWGNQSKLIITYCIDRF